MFSFHTTQLGTRVSRWVLACACCLGSWTLSAQTQVIAHRGFWKTAGSAQNSITALNKAAESHLYGSEFDVQMTVDGVVVVNHDDTIGGFVIHQTPYAQLKDLKLSNGETLPTLTDYLKAGKKWPELQLILEIKPHPTEAQEKQVTETIVKMVKELGLEKQVEYISFSLYICEELVRLSPKSAIAYLKSDKSPQEVKAKGISGIDYYYKVFEQHPEWICEAQQLGMKVNVWTVNQTADLEKMIAWKVDFLTTDVPMEAVKRVDDAKKTKR